MPGSDEATIRIGGMMCGHCAKKVEVAHCALPGVARAEADPGNKLASVVFDPSRTSVEDMKRAIEGAGYRFPGLSVEG